LSGVRVLLVEDSLSLGQAMKGLLQACRAEVTGPIATTTEANRLISEHDFDAALVDINLRGGERAAALIDRLHDQGVRIVATSGYTDPQLSPGRAAATLPKPFSEAQFFAALLAMTRQPSDAANVLPFRDLKPVKRRAAK
jgi:CheY-like chemotaxis protein